MAKCHSSRSWRAFAAVVLAAVLTELAGAQAGAVSVRDMQSGCTVGSIPNAERLSVSWTGDCVRGAANGVGDVIAFSAGRLRYILRGQFRNGVLERQDNVRDCASSACSDDVPPSLLRLHEQGALANNMASASQSAPNALPGASSPPAASTEIRAPDAVYKGRFTVDARSGSVSGSGKVEFFDGRSFEGTLRAGRKEGTGTYVWADGQSYRGEWQDDVQHGRGEWSSKAGDKYQGEFRAGRREGTGTMTYANGMRYEGAWSNDLQSGKGRLLFPNGDEYDGDFVQGERTGVGTFRQRSGDSYSGQWLKGERDGKGVAEWANGQRYDGTWRRNRKEGAGLMRFPDGGTYDGDWREDKATGRGDVVFASGDSYTGQVRDGVPHGNGIFRWGSGDRFEGEFDGGKPTARGQMTYFAEAAAASIASAPQAATEPAMVPSGSSTTTVVVPAVSRSSLCFTAFNSARSVAMLRRFMDSFPDDECGRHVLARQKIAALEEREKLAARALDERAAQARALIGGVVAFRQEFPFCVTGSGSTCQRVVYVFDVKGKIRDIDVQKRLAQVQISDVTSLGNEKGAPAQLFAEGRVAATAAYKARTVGATQAKTLEELGLAF